MARSHLLHRLMEWLSPLVTRLSSQATPAPVRYEIPGTMYFVVKPGDMVEPDRPTLNLHDLMRLKGTEATQRYIINEVLQSAAQGQDVAGRNLEIIVRQMFTGCRLMIQATSTFVMGDIISKASVVDANMNSLGKTPAQPAAAWQYQGEYLSDIDSLPRHLRHDSRADQRYQWPRRPPRVLRRTSSSATVLLYSAHPAARGE